MDAVYDHWGTTAAAPIGRIGVTDAPSPAPGRIDGSEGRGGLRFVAWGGWSAIGVLEAAAEVARGSAGTEIVADSDDE